MSDRNLTGCCILSDRPCFEIRQSWPAWHPKAGEARKIGPALPGARRATLVMMDGRTTTVTVHESAVEHLPTAMTTVCRKALAAFANDLLVQRSGVGMKAPSPREEAVARKAILEWADNPPLGVLCIQPMES